MKISAKIKFAKSATEGHVQLKNDRLKNVELKYGFGCFIAL